MGADQAAVRLSFAGVDELGTEVRLSRQRRAQQGRDDRMEERQSHEIAENGDLDPGVALGSGGAIFSASLGQVAQWLAHHRFASSLRARTDHSGSSDLPRCALSCE